MNLVRHLSIKYKVTSATVKKISEGEAHKRGFFGPVYHGTTSEAREHIEREGFKVFIGLERSEDVRHGYLASAYANGRPAPIHHLGFGIYFTTAKAIGKQFNATAPVTGIWTSSTVHSRFKVCQQAKI